MAYKGRLVEFSKKLGLKSIKILIKIRDASSLLNNKEENTQGMCFFGGKLGIKTIKILKIIRYASS